MPEKQPYSLLSEITDKPMELGDHLQELRRRLFLVLIGLGLVTIVAFGFQHEIKILVGGPLQVALGNFKPDELKQIGLEEAEGIYRLRADTLVEPTVIAAKLSVVAAIVLMFPVLIYQVWSFIPTSLEAHGSFGSVLVFAGGNDLFLCRPWLWVFPRCSWTLLFIDRF